MEAEGRVTCPIDHMIIKNATVSAIQRVGMRIIKNKMILPLPCETDMELTSVLPARVEAHLSKLAYMEKSNFLDIAYFDDDETYGKNT